MLIGLCVLVWSIQFAGTVGSLNVTSAQRAVANYLQVHFKSDANALVFSDEGTVSVMSGIPEEKLLTTSDAPRDRQGFLTYLQQKHVEYLVFVNKRDSTPAKLFPELKEGENVGPFEPVMHSKTRFLRMDIWLYRVDYDKDASQHSGQ